MESTVFAGMVFSVPILKAHVPAWIILPTASLIFIAQLLISPGWT